MCTFTSTVSLTCTDRMFLIENRPDVRQSGENQNGRDRHQARQHPGGVGRRGCWRRFRRLTGVFGTGTEQVPPRITPRLGISPWRRGADRQDSDQLRYSAMSTHLGQDVSIADRENPALHPAGIALPPGSQRESVVSYPEGLARIEVCRLMPTDRDVVSCKLRLMVIRASAACM